MIKAIVRLSAQPYYFELSGHAGAGTRGNDLVCAGISSVSQTALLGLTDVMGLKVKTTIDEDKGYLKVVLPENLSVRQAEDARLIIATMCAGIKDFGSGFPKFVKLEEN